MYFKGETVKGSEMAELDESVTDKSPFAHGYFQRPKIRAWVEVLSHRLRTEEPIAVSSPGDSGLQGPD